MTQQKHLKQLVRARMKRTGESYVTARRHVANRRQPATPRPTAAIDPGAGPQTAKLAGIGSEALRKRTGRGWDEWLVVLDRAGAAELDHRGIVAKLVEAGVGSWWCQMIAVGYEQARGKRAAHQRCDGSFQAGISRTLAVPVAAAWKAWTAKHRGEWLEAAGTIRVRKANPPRKVAKPTTPAASLRIDWSDGTLVLVYFYGKSDGRSSVAVQHEKLPDADAVDAVKALWQHNLKRMQGYLAD